MEKRPGKRERLVKSAQALIHEQGAHRTTLADIAERAEVPLGNVYYYFKSKDELIGAVLDSYQEEAAALTRAFERHREGFQNVGSCCGAVVFVDESAESVAAFDLFAARPWVRVCRLGRVQRECAVGALLVVVGGVDA
jgi:AcrR family transcriptional regulator